MELLAPDVDTGTVCTVQLYTDPSSPHQGCSLYIPGVMFYPLVTWLLIILVVGYWGVAAVYPTNPFLSLSLVLAVYVYYIAVFS